MKLVVGLILICFGLISCNNNSNDSTQLERTIKEVEKNLKNKNFPDREDPFIVRKINTKLNGKWIGEAISYGPYRKGQAPGIKSPSKEDILQDLRILSKNYNLIRAYNSDKDTELILKVIDEYKLPIKVLLGVWLVNETDNEKGRMENNKNVLYSIKLAQKYKDLLFGINVGNESQVFWSAHKMDINDLVNYIRIIRMNTSVPITTADDYNFWNKSESQKIDNEVDFIVTHIYPLWNGKQLEESIDWTNQIFEQVKTMHISKQVVLGEIGWATKYNPMEKGDGQQGSLIKGEVSFKAQELFLNRLKDWTHKNKVVTFLFEAFDEPWKGGGEMSGPDEVEKHWGIFYEDRTPKTSFANFSNNK